jgi:hypothetical protein
VDNSTADLWCCPGKKSTAEDSTEDYRIRCVPLGPDTLITAFVVGEETHLVNWKLSAVSESCEARESIGVATSCGCRETMYECDDDVYAPADSLIEERITHTKGTDRKITRAFGYELVTVVLIVLYSVPMISSCVIPCRNEGNLNRIVSSSFNEWRNKGIQVSLDVNGCCASSWCPSTATLFLQLPPTQ